MSAVEGAVDAAKGPGKKWLIGGAVIGLAYLAWTRLHKGGASSAANAGAATITKGGAAVADPVTPAGGDYSPPADVVSPPSSNGEWLSQATAKLTAAPYNMSASEVWNALTLALSGSPLTSAQGAIVEKALTVAGTPPEGMPLINMSSTSPPASNPTPPAPTAPASNPFVSADGRTLSVGVGANLYDAAGSVGLTGAQFAALNSSIWRSVDKGGNTRWEGTTPFAVRGMPYRIK